MSLEKPKLIQETVFICHDAGGAEVISSYIQHHGFDESCFFLIQGPAEGIFNKKLEIPERQVCSDLAQLTALEVKSALLGTSWSSELEKEALSILKRRNIKTVSFLDHWMNYEDRFQFQNVLTLPDEIWVGDEYALNIANKSIATASVFLKTNFYLHDIAKQINSKVLEAELKPARLLYVTEPSSEVGLKKHNDALYFGYHEKNVLKSYLKSRIPTCSDESIRVRPHPSEKQDKYNDILESFPMLDIEISNETSLIDDVAWATEVIGCQSMAMVVGVVSGRKVYCVMPVSSGDGYLPHKEIERLDLDV